MKTINQLDLDNLLNNGDTFLLDFTASWCAPCRMMTPVLEELSRENPEIPIYKIDSDSNPEAVSFHGVRGIPCIIAFKNGDEIERNIGSAPKKTLKELLDKLK